MKSYRNLNQIGTSKKIERKQRKQIFFNPIYRNPLTQRFTNRKKTTQEMTKAVATGYENLGKDFSKGIENNYQISERNIKFIADLNKTNRKNSSIKKILKIQKAKFKKCSNRRLFSLTCLCGTKFQVIKN